MDITITLYSTSDEPNKVEKTLSTNSFVITGKLKEEQDITAPAITIAIPILSTGVPATDIFQWNYAYISQPFKRYYFITGFDTGLNNLVTIYFKEDYLMSWKTNIYNLTPLVTRQATKYNPMLIDGNIPIRTNPDIILFADTLKYPKFNNTYITYNELILDYHSVLDNYYCFSFKSVSHILYSDSSSKDILRNSSLPTSTTYITTFEDFTKNMETWINPSFWSSVSNWFLETSELITSAVVYPFDILKCTSIYTNTDTISFMPGSTLNAINCKRLYAESTSLCGCELEFTIRYYHNFIDNLCIYKLNLPFYGEITLDTELLLNLFYGDKAKIIINLIFDSGDGSAKYVITYTQLQTFNNNETILYPTPNHIIYSTDTFQLGYNIPLTASNGATRKLNALIGGIKVAGSVALGAAGGALMGMSYFATPATQKAYKKTQDKRLKVGGEKYNQRMSEYRKSLANDVISDQVPSLSNTLSMVANAMHLDISTTQGHSGDLFPFNSTLIGVIITKPVPEIPSNYYELYGGPCNLTVPLSELKGNGFTVCANLHMTGFPNCTLEEINEIENLLLSGVIL